MSEPNVVEMPQEAAVEEETLTPTGRIALVLEAARLLRKAVPEGHVELSLASWKKEVDLTTYSPASYQRATEWLRQFGCGVRHKEIQCGQQTALSASLDGLQLKAIATGLPPTCRKVKYTERVPKTQTVETGEFVEIEREKIVCDGDTEAQQ